MSDPPGEGAHPRYSSRPLPGYRYRPGRSPHPTRHPRGHAFGEPPPSVEAFDAADWPHCDTYRFGIDLYNHGFFWEAHEYLEALWVAAGRRSPTGQFLQGLIQIAAAAIKHETDAPGAAQSLARLGIARLRSKQGTFLGIEVERFTQDVERWIFEDARVPRIDLVLPRPDNAPGGARS